MRKGYMKYFVGGIIIVILVSSALCIFPKEKKHFAEGEIEVIFKENVTLEEAEEVVSSYNCSIIKYFYASYADQKDALRCIVEVPKGEEDDYVKLFEQTI